MSEQDKLLKVLKETLENSQEFVLAQAPEVIQQLILWGRICWPILTIMLLVATLLCVWGARYNLRKYASKEGFNKEEGNAVCGMILSLMGMITAAFMCGSLLDSLQVWICPKVYLLNYFLTRL